MPRISHPASVEASPAYTFRMTPTLDGMRATVITVSDRSARGDRPDAHGPVIGDALQAAGCSVTRMLVPDGASSVEAALRSAIAAGARIIITTGGTGVSRRDLTPEGTAPVIDRALPGIAERIRARGADAAPAAALTRGLAGITAGPTPAFVANFPGSRGGVEDGIAVVLPLLPHLVEQLAGGDH